MDTGKEWTMNLQLFGLDAQEPGMTEGAEGTVEGQESQPRTYSADEVMRLVQSESDKRVTQALAKQKKEIEKQLKLSGMEDTQRTLAEKDDRIAELEEQLREGNLLREKNRVMTALSERGMAPGLADLIMIDEDEDANTNRVTSLETAFNKAVEEAVKRRLAGSPPPRGEGRSAGMTREHFRKLSLRQQQEMAKSDPELYKRLTE